MSSLKSRELTILVVQRTLLTGGVQTKFIENVQPLQLPANSYYHGIKDVIEMQPDKIPFAVEPGEFAHDIMRLVERKTSGKVWYLMRHNRGRDAG